MTEKKQKQKEKAERIVVGTRGRFFEGIVTKKFPTRVVIEFQRAVPIKKYERFYKKKTRIHSYLPANLHDKIEVGDTVKVQECRPLSKIIHSIVIEIVKKSKGEEK